MIDLTALRQHFAEAPATALALQEARIAKLEQAVAVLLNVVYGAVLVPMQPAVPATQTPAPPPPESEAEAEPKPDQGAADPLE